MNKNILILFTACMAFMGCNEFKSGEGDMQYKIVEDKNGNPIKESDFVSITFDEKTEEGEVLQKTNGFDNRPVLMFRTAPYFKGDLNMALGNLSEGDSAIIKINLDSMVKILNIKRPAKTKGKYIVYSLRVNKVITRGTLNDSLLNNEIEKLKADEINKARITESAKINNYIISYKLQPKTTSSGIKYIVKEQGNGARANIGDTVLVNYKLASLDGKVFETNYEKVAKETGIYHRKFIYKPYSVVITAKPTSGFHEILSLFNKNSKAKAIIPSALGYGKDGSKRIEPYTPLLFELEIVDILPKTALKEKRE